MIPAMTADGLLPDGRHPATLDEVRERFVRDAPNSDDRDLVFRALEVHLARARQLFPGATLWLDGGFVTHKPEPPHDVDIVIVYDPSRTPVVAFDDLSSLLTMFAVSCTLGGVPSGQPKLQPMGGLVDAFAVPTTRPDDLAVWDARWRQVKDRPGMVKGYLEVPL